MSLQAYSIAEQLHQSPEAVLRRVQEFGIQNLELVASATPPRVREAIDKLNFRIPTVHANFATDTLRLPGGSSMPVPPFAKTLEYAAEAECEFLIEAYADPAHWTSEQSVVALADRLNACAEQALTYNIRVGYHNHAHEIATELGGRPALQLLADHLDPAVVLEIDLFWAAWAGADLQRLVGDLEDRIVALHVKDGLLETDEPLRYQRAAGEGAVPLASAIKAASQLQYAVIEFDHGYVEDVVDAVGRSAQFLSELGIE